MKLSSRAIELIKQKRVRMNIAVKMGITDQWVSKCLAKNIENGPLTTIHALRVIRQETGMNADEIIAGELAGSKDTK